MSRLEQAIRDARPSDAEAVERLYVQSMNAGLEGLFPPRTYSSKRVRQWESELGQPTQRWWLAVLGGEAVGFAGIGPSRDPVDPGVGELDTIGVLESRWRQGIGSALMKRCLHHLPGDGHSSAVVWTVDGHDQGIGFYESLGWQLDGVTRHHGRQVRLSHPLR